MSAAEYYNSGPGTTRINTSLPPTPSPHSTPSPTPTHSTVSPINKPLPQQPAFPPTHGAAVGYNDSFFGRHHTTQSIDDDTAYHPPSQSPPQGLSHSSSFSNDYDKHQPYNDGIPLKDTRPQHPIAAAEAGAHGKKHRPTPVRRIKKKPWFCWIISTIQIAVFIAEIARNAILTGSPIATKPQFNPMIGPQTTVLINMGARFIPCMKIIDGITDDTTLAYPCPKSTPSDLTSSKCTLAELCGFDGNQIPKEYGGSANRKEPDQWWRFIVPIFLHAGLIHIAFNMLFQLRLGVDMEREIGPVRFAICYFAAGIFGNVFGGNFAPNGLPSVGCSGSLFGIIALILLDLLWNWSHRPSPKKELAFILLDICIGFAIGLLPGLDNFCHIGGFLMGLILGIAVLHSPISLRQKIGAGEPPYTPMTAAYMHGASNGSQPQGTMAFIKSPASFFKGRKQLWWAFWIARAAALATALIVMVVLVNNFYTYQKTCSWCKYLSCLPVSNWCENGVLTVITTNETSSNPARMLARGLATVLELEY